MKKDLLKPSLTKAELDAFLEKAKSVETFQEIDKYMTVFKVLAKFVLKQSQVNSYYLKLINDP